MSTRQVLSFVTIGAGEGGGRLALAFKDFGYRCGAINLCQADLDGLDIPAENKLLIGSGKGTGKDLLIGKELISQESNQKLVLEFLHKLTTDIINPYILLCVAGGGGSGSSLAEKVSELALDLGCPVGMIYTLPSSDEDTISKSNAINTFQHIYNKFAIEGVISPMFIIDNEYMYQQYQIPMKDFYYIINLSAAKAISTFNSFSNLPSKYFSAIDTLDFGRLLSLGGICSLGKIQIINPMDLNKIREDLMAGFFMKGMNLASAKGAGIIVTGPDWMLSDNNISESIKFIFSEVASIIGGGLVYRGVYDDPNSKTLDVHLIFNGLTFPADKFNKLWEDIRNGYTQIKKKQNRLSQMSYDLDDQSIDSFNSSSFAKMKYGETNKKQTNTPEVMSMIRCDNCMLGPDGASTHKYNGNGPIPFTHGRCPKCRGSGMARIST